MPWRIGIRPSKYDSRGLPRTTPSFGSVGWLLDAMATRAADQDVDPAEAAASNFNAIFGLAAGVLIALALDKMFPALLSFNYSSSGHIGDNLVAIIFALIGWLFRAVLVIGIPAVLLYKIFEAAPTFRWVAYPLIGLLYLVYVVHAFGTGTRPVERKLTAATAQQLEQVAQQQAAEDNEREQLTWRRDELAKRLIVNWRADVEYLGATGKPGEIPTVLKVTPLRQHAQVMNLSDRPIHLAVARVKPRAEGGYERCLLDSGNTVPIGPHGSHRFQMLQTGNSPGCMDGLLEFRIGVAGSEDLPWWTRSALEEVAGFAPPSPSLADNSLETMRAQVADLQRRVDETGRADRWRASIQTGR